LKRGEPAESEAQVRVERRNRRAAGREWHAHRMRDVSDECPARLNEAAVREIAARRVLGGVEAR
jgi:hypothetical protein